MQQLEQTFTANLKTNSKYDNVVMDYFSARNAQNIAASMLFFF